MWNWHMQIQYSDLTRLSIFGFLFVSLIGHKSDKVLDICRFKSLQLG